MYIIVLGIFIIKLQISVSDPIFPAHVDFQKVGETIFNNEKFNILKPTTHVIKDHFKEFMLRDGSESPNHPAKRVFIDNNGFRHEWSGFGEKSKSLRKTDLKHLRGSFEVASEDTLKSGTIATNGTVNMTDTVKDSSENNEGKKNNASDNNVSVQNLTEEGNENHSKGTTSTINSISATHVKDSSKEIIIEERLRTGKKDNKNTPKVEDKKGDNKNPAKTEEKKGDDKNIKNPPKAEEKKGDDNKKNTNNEDKNKKNDDKSPAQEKTVMQTTFFCPYLGVITMSRFIDL